MMMSFQTWKKMKLASSRPCAGCPDYVDLDKLPNGLCACGRTLIDGELLLEDELTNYLLNEWQARPKPEIILDATEALRALAECEERKKKNLI